MNKKDLMKEKIENIIGKITDEREKFEKEALSMENQMKEAYMIIQDIQKITGCKSDDGLAIVESVRNLQKFQREKDERSFSKEKASGKEKSIPILNLTMIIEQLKMENIDLKLRLKEEHQKIISLIEEEIEKLQDEMQASKDFDKTIDYNYDLIKVEALQDLLKRIFSSEEHEKTFIKNEGEK